MSLTWFARRRKRGSMPVSCRLLFTSCSRLPRVAALRYRVRTRRPRAAGSFLLDCLLQHRAAHHRARREQAEEIAARGFVEIAVGFVRERGVQLRHTRVIGWRARPRVRQWQSNSSANAVEADRSPGIEGPLDLLPGGVLRSSAVRCNRVSEVRRPRACWMKPWRISRANFRQPATKAAGSALYRWRSSS